MYHTTLVCIAQSYLLGHLQNVQKIVPPQKVVSIFVISYIYEPISFSFYVYALLAED